MIRSIVKCACVCACVCVCGGGGGGDEITSPFLNIKGCAVECWQWINNSASPSVVDVIAYQTQSMEFVY